MELDDDLHLGVYSPLLNNNTVHHHNDSGTPTSLGKQSRGDMDGDRDGNNNPNMNMEASSPTSPLRRATVTSRTMGGQLCRFGTVPCNQNATQVLPASPATTSSSQTRCLLPWAMRSNRRKWRAHLKMPTRDLVQARARIQTQTWTLLQLRMCRRLPV